MTTSTHALTTPSLQPQTQPAPSVDWKASFRAAINEYDPKKKRALCDQATRTVQQRILDQAPTSADPQEIAIFEEALRQLALHKKSHKRKPLHPHSTRIP